MQTADTDTTPSARGEPAELLAAGFATCFHSALRTAACWAGVDVTDSTVDARVHAAPDADGGCTVTIDLDVALPHTDGVTARELTERAHELCPPLAGHGPLTARGAR